MRIIAIITSLLFVWSNLLFPQATDAYKLFLEYKRLSDQGEFENAANSLLPITKLVGILPDSYIAAAFNNIALAKQNIGLYNEALDYFNRGERFVLDKPELINYLGDIYVNKSRIYTFQREFSLANDYLEKAIRLYSRSSLSGNVTFQSLSSAYTNLGIVYYESGLYSKALDYFNHSAFIKVQNNLSSIGLSYLNLAKTYNKLNRPEEAELYFKKSLGSFEKEYGSDYYRTAEVWFEYAKFLQQRGRDAEAVDAHTRALDLCLKVYGRKHPLTALAYKNSGDYYTLAGVYDTALVYYQKALISIAPGFENPDITSNPEPGSALFDIRLLEILKSKASAFEKLASLKTYTGEKTWCLKNSLEALGLALNLIEKIRSGYLTEENRLYLAANEKETYLQGVHAAYHLHEMTGTRESAELMYSIASRCKAAVLRSEIAGREYLYSAGLPDTLHSRQEYLARNIAAYSHLITQESRRPHPDSSRISAWKDALFDLNRQNERLEQDISRLFPGYREMLEKTRPVPLPEIQKRLSATETVVDYLMSDASSPMAAIGGDSDKESLSGRLFTFIITRRNLKCIETEVDSLFDINTAVIRNMVAPENTLGMESGSFGALTGALHYMYGTLVADAEKHFAGRRIIIIPDGRMALLPFEAFIREKPSAGEGFESLHYLVRDFVISYVYSSSLIGEGVKTGGKTHELLAFVPSYGSGITVGVQPLEGAGRELDQAFRRFRGRMYSASGATKDQFMKVLGSGAVLHLAMHSVADTSDQRFSYLLFSTAADTNAGGRLYNYEISLTRVNSPLVVLSACNSGAGPLSSVEGALSIARSFELAGAGAVIRTSWEINDETSAGIISSFYRRLSSGKRKDEALRLAKLDYISSNPPSLVHPAYWAAYEIMGDTRPLASDKKDLLWQALVIIVSVSLIIFYLRRRRTFSARSR